MRPRLQRSIDFNGIPGALPRASLMLPRWGENIPARVTFCVNDCTLYGRRRKNDSRLDSLLYHGGSCPVDAGGVTTGQEPPWYFVRRRLFGTEAFKAQSVTFQRLPICLILLFLYFFTEGIASADSKQTKSIELTDPVYPKQPKKPHSLVVHYDTQGFPSGYSMDLINKVCLDDVCKQVEVTLYWDAIGFYQRLEYPQDQPLTKVEHDPFTAADYEKLDSILKDQKSILKDHELGFLAKDTDDTTTSTKADETDGTSKATPGAVKEAVVKDAAWTTWVLWKYTNTEIVPKLQALTESRCSTKYLDHLLDSKDWRKIKFSLDYLLKQKPIPDQYLNKVVKLMPTADIDHIELAIEYIQQASPDKNTGYRKLISTLAELEEYSASLVIELLESDKQLDQETLEELTSSLSQQDYYPIHLALRLVESRNAFSKQIETDIATLLHSKDFFIARRASEFLSKQELSASAKKVLQAFKEKHADRL